MKNLEANRHNRDR